jgi:hypothetical protein
MIWAFPEILATPASAQAAVDSSRCILLDGPSSPASSAVDQQFTRTTRTAGPARRTPSAAATSRMPVGPAAPEPPRPRPRHHPRCPGSALCSGDTARRGPPAGPAHICGRQVSRPSDATDPHAQLPTAMRPGSPTTLPSCDRLSPPIPDLSRRVRCRSRAFLLLNHLGFE